MIDLGALKIGIKVDKDSAISDLNSVSGVAESTQSKFAGFGKKLKTGAMVGGTAIVAATGALAGMANKASDSTDRIDKMSQKMGLSRDAFQEWDYVMSQNGVSIDSVGAGMKTLTNQFDDLGKGSKNATEAFGELGLKYEDLEGKSQEEIFEMTIKGLQGMEDETKRAAIANDLLGRSGQELAPLLNAGAESTEELKKRAHELGMVLNDDAIDAGVKFQDTMDDLKRSFGAAVTQIGVQVMPMFQNFADWVLDNMPQIQAFFKKAFDVIGTVVMEAWRIFSEYLLPIFQAVFNFISENWPIFSAIIETAFAVIKAAWDYILKPVLDVLLSIFGDVFSWGEKHWPMIQSTIETVFGVISDVVGGVVDIFKGLVEWIGKAFDKWNEWRNRSPDEEVKTTGGSFGGISRDLAAFDGRHASGLDYVPYDGCEYSLAA